MGLTADQLCSQLLIAPKKLPSLVKQGLPCTGRGASRRFDAAAAEAWLVAKGHLQPPAAEYAVARTRAELARILGVSERTIATWIREGMPGKSGRPGVKEANYPIEEIQAWLGGRVSAENTPQDATKHQAQARLASVNAELAELKLRTRLGQLVEADEVRRRWLRFSTEAKAQLDQLPPRLIKALGDKLDAKVRDRLRTTLKRTIAGACQTLELFLRNEADALEAATEPADPE